MYRKCTTEVSVLHQEQVEEALLELMQKIPYEDITVTQLCQSAGVSRRIFYHLFRNKTGALHALIDHKILALEGCYPEISDDALRYFCYWKAQKPLLDALWANNLTGLLLERMILIVLDENYDLQYWMRKNGWSRDREVLIFQLSGIMGLTCSWYFSGYAQSTEEMAALITRIMTQPFAADNSGK